jgi:NADH-ubiquinone oxidoreductase chain 5
VFSSLIGLFQQDIKKVIAYSTMSQLGMMVIAVGLSCYNIALFHLINHAFYKGLLFLGAGAVIHAVADNQDFRRYGGLIPFLPLTYSVILIASLSLVAFPFMTGFYSKDFILESAYGQYYFSSTVVYIIATIGAMFTTLYSVKVLYLTFLTNPNGPLINYKQAHEGDIFMSLPLIILAVFSIFFGFITKDMFIGLGSDFFSDNALFIHPSHEIMLDTEFGVPTIFKLLPLIFTISLSVISIVLSEYLSTILIYFKLSRVGYNIFSFFNQRFLIELFYNKFITGIVLKLGGDTTKIIDKGSVEYLGPYGLEKLFLNISSHISNLSTSIITTYGLYTVIGIILYIGLVSSLYIHTILFLCFVISFCGKGYLINSLASRPFDGLVLKSAPPTEYDGYSGGDETNEGPESDDDKSEDETNEGPESEDETNEGPESDDSSDDDAHAHDKELHHKLAGDLDIARIKRTDLENQQDLNKRDDNKEAIAEVEKVMEENAKVIVDTKKNIKENGGKVFLDSDTCKEGDYDRKFGKMIPEQQQAYLSKPENMDRQLAADRQVRQEALDKEALDRQNMSERQRMEDIFYRSPMMSDVNNNPETSVFLITGRFPIFLILSILYRTLRLHPIYNVYLNYYIDRIISIFYGISFYLYIILIFLFIILILSIIIVF